MISSRTYAWAGPAVLVTGWWAAATFGSVDPTLLPEPGRVFDRLQHLVAEERFWIDLGHTCYRWLSGFFLGAAAGTLIGLIVGSWPKLYASMEFLIEFFRALPVTALFPLFLLLFGIEDLSKIAMVATATFFPVLINSAAGCLNSSDVRMQVARVFGASRLQLFSTVVVFEAAPHIMVGLRTALSTSLIVVILTEMMIGASGGTGQRLYDAYARNDAADIFALIVVLGTVGYLTNSSLFRLERRLVFWAGQ